MFHFNVEPVSGGWAVVVRSYNGRLMSIMTPYARKKEARDHLARLGGTHAPMDGDAYV